jgi:hypothetical protein
MSSSGGNSAGGDRGQSYLIGVILIIGLVLVGSVVVLLIGNFAIDDLQQSVDIQEAEYSMREVDSRLSEISTSPNDVHTLDFSGKGGDVEVRKNSYMLITANGKPSKCQEKVKLGSIIKNSGDGEQIAYEGGGVWRKSGDGSVMLSPPDLQYRDGTINFPVVGIGGSVSGQVGDLKAEKDKTASKQRTKQIRQTLSKSACWPPSSIEITVKSQYYDAWARYFEKEIGGSAKRMPAQNKASIEITKLASLNAKKSGKSISSDEEFVATVEIVGIAASAGGGSKSNPKPIRPDVVNARVIVNEDGGSKRILTPWPDGDKTDSIQKWTDDLNHPDELKGDFPGGFKYKTKKLPPDSEVTLEMRAPKPNQWDNSGRFVTRNTNSHEYFKPDSSQGTSDDRFWIDTADKNEENIILREDGETVPTYGVAASHQPTLDEMLGPRLAPGTDKLQMKNNEVAVLFELSEENADPKNAPSAGGSGNPDYNDAVAVITIEPVGGATLGYGADFSIKISYNRVTVTEN